VKRLSCVLILVISTVVLLASCSGGGCGGGSTGGGGGGTTSANLDTTFNATGIVTTAIGTSDDDATAVAIQADGKIVESGYSYNGSQYVFALVRYNTDGTLDTAFNATGVVTTAIGTKDDEATAVAIQPDGKIVAAGYSYNGSQYVFALVRYNTDGTLDTAFNATGIVTTAIGTKDNEATAVAIQPDGKIVAAGLSNNGSQYVFALVRYNTDGTLDSAFNATGIVTTAIGTVNDVAFAVAIQADGKIVAAGYSYNGSQNVFALVRYNNDGTLDMAFNATGIVTTAIGTGNDKAFAVAIQADGKIVAAGYAYNGSQYVFALVRYNTDGTLDTAFNATGIVTTAIGTGNEAFAVAIRTDGKIVAAGYSYNGSQYVFALVRYNTDGTLDTTFNTTGIATTAIGTSDDEATAVAIQADGKIVAAGYSYNGSQYVFATARYLP
jgi:uncharacterized delta-60 repeat protein